MKVALVSLPGLGRSWLSARGEVYARVMVALCLNVPFLMAALARHLEGIAWASLAGLYTGFVFLGYYVFILLFLLTCLFFVTGFWRQLYVGTSAILLTSALFYLLVNGVVYQFLRIHIDAFWLQSLFTSSSGLGIGPGTLLAILAVLCLTAVLEWWLLRAAARIRDGRLLTTGLVATSVLTFTASQVIHIVAYEANDERITAITPQLPLYYPVTSHRNAVKYAGLLPMTTESRASASGNPSTSLRYPLHDVRCTVEPGPRRPNILLLLLESWRADAMDSVVTPHMHALSRRSSVFVNHFSSGNATPAGVFSLFYGIHSTYWTAVKANSASINNPVLIDALISNGYAFGVFAKSDFKRHKIADAVFRGIEVHESFAGRTPDVRDRHMTDALFAFMQDQHRTGKPFFGFAFYKSTHFGYDYPRESALFSPARDLNVALASARDDPTPYLNDYKNSVWYVDGLVGSLLRQMEAAGILENTVVLITSDHGEEFNDNHRNYWGHSGNFTRYQTQVPLLAYFPWKEPRRVVRPTSHVDIVPTLLQEALGCGDQVNDYSTGRNLFDALDAQRAMVISSYVNHAVVVGNDVLVVYPMLLKKYRLDDIGSEAGSPPAQVTAEVIEQMHRFYGATKPHDLTIPARLGGQKTSTSPATSTATTTISPITAIRPVRASSDEESRWRVLHIMSPSPRPPPRP